MSCPGLCTQDTDASPAAPLAYSLPSQSQRRPSHARSPHVRVLLGRRHRGPPASLPAAPTAARCCTTSRLAAWSSPARLAARSSSSARSLARRSACCTTSPALYTKRRCSSRTQDGGSRPGTVSKGVCVWGGGGSALSAEVVGCLADLTSMLSMNLKPDCGQADGSQQGGGADQAISQAKARVGQEPTQHAA